MRTVLSDSQRRQFQDRGYVFPVRVLSPADADRYRAHCMNLEAALGGAPRTIEVRQMHFHLAWADALIRSTSLVEAAALLLGDDLVVWATELFAKHPGDVITRIGWHRDQDFVDFDGPAATAWLALSDSDAGNGALQVKEENALAPTVLELTAGEASFHDGGVLHGSGPNPSSRTRIGVAVRFAAASARPRSGRIAATLVRGCDRSGHFNLMTSPARDAGLTKENLRAMRSSALIHLDQLLSKRIGRSAEGTFRCSSLPQL